MLSVMSSVLGLLVPKAHNRKSGTACWKSVISCSQSSSAASTTALAAAALGPNVDAKLSLASPRFTQLIVESSARVSSASMCNRRLKLSLTLFWPRRNNARFLAVVMGSFPDCVREGNSGRSSESGQRNHSELGALLYNAPTRNLHSVGMQHVCKLDAID